jgi:hypothetical protein
MDFSPYKLGLTMTNPYPGKKGKKWQIMGIEESTYLERKKIIFKQNIS